MIIDNKKMQDMRVDIDKAFAEISKKHEVNLVVGNGSYTDNIFSFKVKGAVISTDENSVTEESEKFKWYANDYGLEPEDLYKVVRIDGEDYKIVGLNTRRSKYPLSMMKVRDGKKYKMPARMVVEAIGNR